MRRQTGYRENLRAPHLIGYFSRPKRVPKVGWIPHEPTCNGCTINRVFWFVSCALYHECDKEHEILLMGLRKY
jgi:hypothetical protein